MKRIAIIILFFVFGDKLRAQNITPQEYIATYKDLAVEEMKRVGIPASVTLAQGILETESGNSDLVKRSNNHFGIKCKSTWRGETVTHTDDAPDECFRKYPKAEDSYRDHSDYLKTSARYASLFELDPSDYKGWAQGLRKAGYATNPRYPQILISNIERYNLQQYDSLSPVAVPSPIAKIDETVITGKSAAFDAIPPAALIINKTTKFNSLRAYYAARGTSLLAITIAADIPLVKLLEYNDLSTDGLLKETAWIYLEKKAKEGNRDIYTSLEDETLYNVSQNNGVQLSSLAAFNNMPANQFIKKGTKIKLRPSQQLTAN